MKMVISLQESTYPVHGTVTGMKTMHGTASVVFYCIVSLDSFRFYSYRELYYFKSCYLQF